MDPAVRPLIYALLAVLLLLLLIALALPRLIPSPPTGAVPPAPEISVSKGKIPASDVSLQEWVHYQDGGNERVGCGFILRYSPVGVVGVTTAHSVDLHQSRRVFDEITFRRSEDGETILAAGGFHGPPGRARTFGLDMRVDYLLLEAPPSTPSAYVLVADPRGSAQPGEAVLLLGCGRGDSDRSRGLGGDVLEASEDATWIIMRERFDPGMMSGSPIVSAHTGAVVGMAVAASWQEDRLLIGAHPIGSLMGRAVDGQDSPFLISEFRR